MNTITRANICTASGYFFGENQGIEYVELTFKTEPVVRIWADGSVDHLDEIKTGYDQILDEAVATACRYLGF